MTEQPPFPSTTGSSATRHERRDAAENRCRILDVAKRLFQQCGVEAVSMHQIAKEAGVGQGTLYRRYGEKSELCADLVKEAAEDALRELSEWIAQTQGKMSGLETLDAILARVIEFTATRGPLLAACKMYMEKNPASRSDNTIYDQLHEVIARLIQRIVEERHTPDIDVMLVTDMLVASLNPRLLLFEREVRGYSNEQILAAIRRIYLVGLFGADRAE